MGALSSKNPHPCASVQIAAMMLYKSCRGYSGSYTSILPLYLEQEGGFTVQMAGVVAAVQGFASIIGGTLGTQTTTGQTHSSPAKCIYRTQVKP